MYHVVEWVRFLADVDDDASVYEHVKEHGRTIAEDIKLNNPDADDRFRYPIP